MASVPLLRRALGRVRPLAGLVPLTPRGALVGAASILALWKLGVDSVDLVVYVLGIAGVVLLLLSLLSVGGTALYLSRRLRPERTVVTRLESGAPVRTGFSIPSLGMLPLVDVRWEWLEPGGMTVRRLRREGRLYEEVVAARRGGVGRIRRRIEVADVFGLARVRFVLEEPLAVTIVPGLGRLRSLELPRSIAAGEDSPHPSGAPLGDRMDIRRYAPGDPARNIMWKVYARTRELSVRLPESSLAPARRVVAYLVTGEGDEPAAAAARLAVESGALGREFAFGCDGTPGSVSETSLCLDAIARSGSREAGSSRPGEALPRLLDEAARSGAHCIVFAPATGGPWTASVERAARAHPGRLSFVLGADGVRPAEARDLASRFLFVPDAQRGVSRSAIAELCRSLDAISRASTSVTLVDRATGRCYPRAAIGEAA